MDDEKTEVTSIRLPRTMKRAARAKAALEGRTLTHVIRELVGEYVADPEAKSYWRS